jgi:hypothetical protein
MGSCGTEFAERSSRTRDVQLGKLVLFVYQQLMRTMRTILYIEHHGVSATYANSVLKLGIVGMESFPTIRLPHLS